LLPLSRHKIEFNQLIWILTFEYKSGGGRWCYFKIRGYHPGDNQKSKEFNLIIDRIVVNKDDDSISRYGDSVQDAYRHGDNICIIRTIDGDSSDGQFFSNRFEEDGLTFEEPSVHMFSFNNPLGACPVCEDMAK